MLAGSILGSISASIPALTIDIDWNSVTNLLLQTVQTLQQALLHLMHGLGITHDIDGQPAWPFAARLSGEVLVIDRSVTRALAGALAYSLLALLSLAAALIWRRFRIPLLLLAIAIGALTPWPDIGLLSQPASASSFHVSPTAFSAQAINRGERVYSQFCLSCHGADGKGNTRIGLALAIAPPNLSSGLLWRRPDGDVLWSIRHGKGEMPAFAEQISVADSWALIDYMKANAAGVNIRETGLWQRPVAIPDMELNCAPSNAARIADWHGQRIKLIVAPAEGAALPLEDPRFQTLLLNAGARPAAAAATDTGRIGAIQCNNAAAESLHALSIITAIADQRLAGAQLIADRDGWVRALKRPANTANTADAADAADAWSDEDMLCRPPSASDSKPAAGKDTAAQGLEKLIATMDAEPIRFIKGGFYH
jgi:mono/diheme cytochrome c family protein